ncbi:MAG TPA: hypothetical protein VJ505_04360 [Holophagaceae bacterium]|nr:hypothetical protein [Holophagaceae bacterium]HJW32580.1 hypothetical protein [Holophagaceae bacterium]
MHQETNFTTAEVEWLKTMSEKHAFAGNFRKALEYHRRSKEESDAILHPELTRKIHESAAGADPHFQRRGSPD